MSSICFWLTWRSRFQIYPPALNTLKPEAYVKRWFSDRREEAAPREGAGRPWATLLPAREDKAPVLVRSGLSRPARRQGGERGGPERGE